uniref:PGG domain-containing protein n=1 Tax=Fagus sylvatica TaxID=28930 RepID=A0A2N9IFJ2_FAGSY
MADQQEDRSLRSEISEFMYKPGIDSKSDVRNALLVVATLIAAVTFQAGVNPPGGVWQENDPPNCPTPTQDNSPTPTPTPTQDNSPTPTQGSRLTQCHEAGKAILGSKKIALFFMSCTYNASIGAVASQGKFS